MTNLHGQIKAPRRYGSFDPRVNTDSRRNGERSERHFGHNRVGGLRVLMLVLRLVRSPPARPSDVTHRTGQTYSTQCTPGRVGFLRRSTGNSPTAADKR